MFSNHPLGWVTGQPFPPTFINDPPQDIPGLWVGVCVFCGGSLGGPYSEDLYHPACAKKAEKEPPFPPELALLLNEAWWKLPRRVRNKMLNVRGPYDWEDFWSSPKTGPHQPPFWGHLHKFYDQRIRDYVSAHLDSFPLKDGSRNWIWERASNWRPPASSWDSASD